MSENSSPATTKISTYLMIIVLIVLALSIVALIWAVQVFPSDMAAYLLIIGFIAMALSVYVLFQSRKRMANMKIEAPKVMTTVECKKCGFKSVREFQRGDFIFKELEACQKCEDKMMITAIYKEVKEKEKAFPF